MSSVPILDVDAVTVDFGGNRALSDAGFTVASAAVTGLIGPNGAGKTTLFNVITGVVTPTRGRVRFDGVDVTTLETHRRARLGIARTFQRLELFSDLTVVENLQVAAEIRATWRGWRPGRLRGDALRQAQLLVDRLALGPVANTRVAEIPTGLARVVEVGRALMIQPRLLLLDEPASGQSDEETRRFADLLREIAAVEQIAVLLIEHDVELVMGVCDTVHVLDFGEIIASGPPDTVRNDARVRDAYLGAER